MMAEVGPAKKTDGNTIRRQGTEAAILKLMQAECALPAMLRKQ